MSFSKFIASAAIAVSTIFVPSVEASSLTPGQGRLVDALYEAGVTIEVGECPTDDMYGFYSPKHNFIGICNNVATEVDQRWETLRHEAIHAAQACIDPSMQTTVHAWMYVDQHLTDYHEQFIMSAYEQEDWVIEAEAFTFMTESDEYVANMVEVAC